MEQTVNLSSYDFEGSNPSLPTREIINLKSESLVVDNAVKFQNRNEIQIYNFKIKRK